MMRYLWIVLGTIVALGVLQVLCFAGVMAWADQQTNDGRYYALSRKQRARFRARMRRQARLLMPLFWALSRMSKFELKAATFQFRGVAGPKGACDEASFARGTSYQAQPEDVFVVTQMKCGTTWMQHLVYQLVTAGKNPLEASGEALYAVSPWLESRKTIPVEQARLLGQQRPTRLIKTHFPRTLCPFDSRARYIYVARDPVSCFASCVDFLRSNLGPFTLSLEACENWYCSPEWMWWQTWPEHVAGWWQCAQESDNVLFVKFEEMTEDLPAVARRVETLLGLIPLSDQELADVLAPCSFQRMRDNFDLFEMQVPHVLQDAAAFFQSGRADRHRDIPEELSRRIATWSREQLLSLGVAPGEFYWSANSAHQP
jgi:hypothetical protein